jgi:hypothetical protein
MAVDGFMLDAAETPDNVKEFGRLMRDRKRARFPRPVCWLSRNAAPMPSPQHRLARAELMNVLCSLTYSVTSSRTC